MNTETIMLTIALSLTIVLVAGLLVIPEIQLQKQVEAAKSITGQCASAIKNASSSLCPKGPPEPVR